MRYLISLFAPRPLHRSFALRRADGEVTVDVEASLGVAWQFRDKCTLRLQYAYSHNSSNIDIYDFNRSEISFGDTAILHNGTDRAVVAAW